MEEKQLHSLFTKINKKNHVYDLDLNQIQGFILIQFTLLQVFYMYYIPDMDGLAK